MPSLRFARVLRPRSAAMRINSPTPSTSMETKGSRAIRPLARYSLRNVPASSRRHAQRGLGEIVGAEGEEFRGLGDLAGAQARRAAVRSWCRSDNPALCPRSFLDRLRPRAAMRAASRSSSVLKPTSGIMISSCDGLAARFFHIGGRFQNGARLHLVDFRIGDAQPAAAMAQHGIGFMQARSARARNFAGIAAGGAARLPRSLPPCAAGIRAAADRAGGW